jgi:hypothetical protein
MKKSKAKQCEALMDTVILLCNLMAKWDELFFLEKDYSSAGLSKYTKYEWRQR